MSLPLLRLNQVLFGDDDGVMRDGYTNPASIPGILLRLQCAACSPQSVPARGPFTSLYVRGRSTTQRKFPRSVNLASMRHIMCNCDGTDTTRTHSCRLSPAIPLQDEKPRKLFGVGESKSNMRQQCHPLCQLTRNYFRELFFSQQASGGKGRRDAQLPYRPEAQDQANRGRLTLEVKICIRRDDAARPGRAVTVVGRDA